jgi:hypothetical protein
MVINPSGGTCTSGSTVDERGAGVRQGDPLRAEARAVGEPAAEGPLSGEYLTGTLTFLDGSGAVDVSLLIGKVVEKFKQSDQTGSFRVHPREVTGTVTLDGTT